VYICNPFSALKYAEVAQLVEHHLAKVRVAGSNLVFRSFFSPRSNAGCFFYCTIVSVALVVELVDTQDLKSCSPQREYGFDSRLGHHK
jgi:hypothetical protein